MKSVFFALAVSFVLAAGSFGSSASADEGSVTQCRAFGTKQFPKFTGGAFTAWISGQTEEEARENALDACTEYSSGCVISKCRTTKEVAQVVYTTKCLASGTYHSTKATRIQYDAGFGVDQAQAEENAEKACAQRGGQACRVVSCKAIKN